MARSWWQPPTLRTGADEPGERHATWLELFYDLVFVVAVAQLAHNLSYDVTAMGFLRFVALFIPVWWCWVGAAFYATRFDTDDAGHRLFTVMQMFAVAALAVNARDAFGDSSVGFALSYVAVRMLLVLEYLRAKRHVADAGRLIRRYSRGFSVSAAIWLASVFVPIPLRFVFWGIGMAIDIGTPVTAGQLHAQLPPHLSHMPERFGLFTIIVLGESVAGVVRGVGQHSWGFTSTVTAALGLGIAFGIWWIYFDSMGGGAILAAITTRRVSTYQSWLYAHFFLAVGITALGVSIDLVTRSAQFVPVTAPERWFACVSLAICLVALAVIHVTTVRPSDSHRLRDEKGEIYRLVGSVAVLIVAALGGSMIPIVLAAILTVICATLVVLDFYERMMHEDY